MKGLFWPQAHNLNKLGRGPLCDAIYYQGSRPNGLRQEDFFMLSLLPSLYTSHLQTHPPPRGPGIAGLKCRDFTFEVSR